MVLVLSISGVFGDHREEFARQEIQIIASQIERFELRVKSKKSQRMPSSLAKDAPLLSTDEGLKPLGTIGRDPWGQAYNYIFLPSPEGEKVYLFVWSSGENKVNEVRVNDLKKLFQNEAVPAHVSKDDIFFIKELASRASR